MKKSFMTRVLAAGLSLAMAFSLAATTNVSTAAAAAKPAMAYSTMTVKVGQTKNFKAAKKTRQAGYKIVKVKMSTAGKTKADVTINSNKKSIKITGKAATAGSKLKITFKKGKTSTVVTTKVVVTEKTGSEGAGDFLSQHGIRISPNSSNFEMTVPLAVGARDTLTDEVENVTIQGMVLQLITDKYDGCPYTDELTVTIPLTEEGNTFNITAFDRYTGRFFESMASDLDDGSVSQSITVDVDGNKYDCVMDAYSYINDNNECVVTCLVSHPMEYDGVVFAFGQMTKTQMADYNNIDFSSEFTIADYPNVFIDGQTFFTISGK